MRENGKGKIKAAKINNSQKKVHDKASPRVRTGKKNS